MSSSTLTTSKVAATKNNMPRPVAPTREGFAFGHWTIQTSKGVILNKDQADKLESDLKLPHVPDMVFPDNWLSLTYAPCPASREGKELKAPMTIKFCPFDALKLVDNKHDLVRVSLSNKWLEARKDSPHINNVVNPYDWTFTPAGYNGVVTPDPLRLEEDDKTSNKLPNVCATKDRIDYEKLKEKEKILFYDDIVLYEDELDDNGCAKLSCKIRVMPSGFFCLCRFYLRVDATLIRVHDTRLYHKVGTGFLIRECTERESSAGELSGIPLGMWTDQNAIVERLRLRKEVNEKITFSNETG